MLTVSSYSNFEQTSMSSKIIAKSSDYFADLCVNAVSSVKRESEGQTKYPVSAISIIKVCDLIDGLEQPPPF